MPIAKSERRLQPAHATKQERSRSTLKRILAAAERLLDDVDFDSLTMNQLAAEAGCGVGTLYGRIPNKESLLLLLHDHYMDSGLAATEKLYAAGGDRLEQRARAVCSLFVDFLAARRGVVRAITAHLFGP